MILTLEQQERVKLTPAVNNQHGNYCDGPVDFHLCVLNVPPHPTPLLPDSV